MSKTKPIVRIENVVASATIEQRLDLKGITEKFPNTEWNPEQFPELIHRMLDPKTVILIFASGKLACTGGKTEQDVYRSVNLLHAMLEEKELMAYY